MRERPLWLRKTSHQLVAQWTARRAPSQWCDDTLQRDRLITSLCLELIFAIALRVPDRAIAADLLALHRKAKQPAEPSHRNPEILSLEEVF
ncbi:hypothetical protein ACLBKU_16030 [Erythrobacter sp. NE805]|uniref:hypothetical protein n=1 Tax=Erythrobacter sp. NE805 TaxID=3389875 RepID=UPI00396AF7B2